MNLSPRLISCTIVLSIELGTALLICGGCGNTATRQPYPFMPPGYVFRPSSEAQINFSGLDWNGPPAPPPPPSASYDDRVEYKKEQALENKQRNETPDAFTIIVSRSGSVRYTVIRTKGAKKLTIHNSAKLTHALTAKLFADLDAYGEHPSNLNGELIVMEDNGHYNIKYSGLYCSLSGLDSKYAGDSIDDASKIAQTLKLIQSSASTK